MRTLAVLVFAAVALAGASAFAAEAGAAAPDEAAATEPSGPVGPIGPIGPTLADGAGTPVPSKLTVRLAGQLFAGWRGTYTDADDDNEFEVDRAEVGLGVAWGQRAGLALRSEAVRSATPGSVLGVDGDSLVLRAKHAFGWGRAQRGRLSGEVRLGLVPEPWLEAVEAGYDLRGLAPLLAERARLYDSADLGLVVRGALGSQATVALSALNGEGRNQLEQNDGKNLGVVAGVRAARLRLWGGEALLWAHGGARLGGTGAGNARAHRVAGALTMLSPRLAAGAELVHATGVDGAADRQALVVGGWARVAALPWAGAMLRYDRSDVDTEADDAVVHSFSAGLYADLVERRAGQELRVFAAWQRERFGANAGALAGAGVVSDSDRIVIELAASVVALAHWLGEEP